MPEPLVTVQIERPASPEIAALIDERVAHSLASFPPESIHAFDLSQLDRPGITFWTARIDGRLAGCGALQTQGDGNGEIKSMFVRSAWRGEGVSRYVLAAIETEARAVGLKRLNLETGTDSMVARGLYESFGYVYCGSFGGYRPDPLSVFMTKVLD